MISISTAIIRVSKFSYVHRSAPFSTTMLGRTTKVYADGRSIRRDLVTWLPVGCQYVPFVLLAFFLHVLFLPSRMHSLEAMCISRSRGAVAIGKPFTMYTYFE